MASAHQFFDSLIFMDFFHIQDAYLGAYLFQLLMEMHLAHAFVTFHEKR